jgi:hypothetical protein
MPSALPAAMVARPAATSITGARKVSTGRSPSPRPSTSPKGEIPYAAMPNRT